MKKYNINNIGSSSSLKKVIIGESSAFSIIEIMVGIFIFSLGIASVFAIISSTLQITDYNKNYIIATNLASEQIELIRNIRDSNYKKIQKYNQINPGNIDYNNLFETGKKYKIENNYSTSANFPIIVTDITTGFEEGQSKLKGISMNSYNLCLDSLNRYTYNCDTGSKRTIFYKYIGIEKVKYTESGIEKQIDNAFIVKSKVIWYSKGYHEFEVKSIIADWKRL